MISGRRSDDKCGGGGGGGGGLVRERDGDDQWPPLPCRDMAWVGNQPVWVILCFPNQYALRPKKKKSVSPAYSLSVSRIQCRYWNTLRQKYEMNKYVRLLRSFPNVAGKYSARLSGITVQ